MVVLVNKKSGGQVGNDFLNAFYRILNPLQVISVLDEGLDSTSAGIQNSDSSKKCPSCCSSSRAATALSAQS